MGSIALIELSDGLEEVNALRLHSPRAGRSRSRARSKAIAAGVAQRRASLVLLCSHYERYIRHVNEHAVYYINNIGLSTLHIPEEIRLLQVRSELETLAAQQWTARAKNLEAFVTGTGRLWDPAETVTSLDPDKMLSFMGSPKVKEVVRYYKMWSITNIFESITRGAGGKARFYREITSLVDRRNGIAHGDQQVQPTGPELTQAVRVVEQFCARADRVLATQLAGIASSAPPW